MRLYVKDVNINPSKICGRVLGRDVKLFAATTAHRLMFFYIPFDSGDLARNVNIYAEGTAGRDSFYTAVCTPYVQGEEL